MKKLRIIKLLGFTSILLFSVSCSSDTDFPYEVGDRVYKIKNKYMNNKLEWHTFIFFDYERRNYVFRSDIHEVIIIDIHSYPKKRVTKRDFYKLQFGMNIYDVVEIVGLPFKNDMGWFYFKTTDNSFTCKLLFSYDPKESKDLMMI